MAAPQYTGTQLYNQMQGLGNDAEKFLFYRANMGTGSGGNDLQSQWLNQGFGGDLSKFNNWINTQELNTKGAFDPSTGTFNYYTGGSANPVTSTLAGWGGASFGGAPGTHNAATSGFSEAQTGTPFQTGVAQNGAWLDPQTQAQLSGAGGAPRPGGGAGGGGLGMGAGAGVTGGAGLVGSAPATLGALASGAAAGGDPGMGTFTGKPTDYFDEAGYKFRLGQGLDQVQNSAAARGSLQSGATLKGLEDYRQGLASQEYGAAFDRFTNARDFSESGRRDNRNFGEAQFQDRRNFGENQYQDRRNFDYGASRDDRNFDWQREMYNQQFGYNAARDDRNFNYGSMRDLAQMGLGATGSSGNLASQLADALGRYGMTGAGAGAQGTVGQSNNINSAISQLLAWMQSNQALGALGRP